MKTKNKNYTEKKKKYISTILPKLNKIHNNKYDYSRSIYVNTRTKIEVRCIKHNIIFSPSLANHLNGSGCPKCGIKSQSEKIKLNIEDFIKRSCKLHKNKYGYSEIGPSILYDKKTKITCNTHGLFYQTPHSHLMGRGCKKCADEKKAFGMKGFIQKPTIMYYVKIGNLYKLGITTTSIKKRFYGENNIETIGSWIFIKGEDAWKTEKIILKETKKNIYVGPRVLKAGNTEIRNIDIIKTIKKYLEKRSPPWK